MDNIPYVELGIRDVVWMLRFAIIRSQPGTSRLMVALYVCNSDNRPPRLTKPCRRAPGCKSFLSE
jgi:hypothetical protein